VKLLFDENLSPRLVELLLSDFPDSAHVRSVGLLGADDSLVWNHAQHHGFIIVSKDNDFRQRSFLSGAPPKIVWLSVGNAGTLVIAALLLSARPRIQEFESDVEASLLTLAQSVD